ncbi:SpoIIE family protein phosphatase [Sphaerisporangium corydalis]|uniref:histidine kinase n=1 Tax=Sphaerisporangium corydalis TaxID=1441875 RepID=A0ABV9EUK2_9ACTN|nr:SpoIIE family protein phosphatase [Sphaerisporangium corydalis]
MRRPPLSGIEATLSGGGAMGALMLAHDWPATPLGPMQDWPQSLRSSLSVCLASRFPMFVYWGPHLVQLYNDAFVPILGGKHPHALGQSAEEGWREAWDTVGPMLEHVLSSGEATYFEDLPVILQRSGFPEECYFTFSYSPVRDEDGQVSGVVGVVSETTGRVLGERGLAVLRELGERTMAATSAAQACAHAAEVFARHATDVPFALLYLLSDDGQEATLAGTAGLEPGGPLSPPTVTLPDGTPGGTVSGEGDHLWPLGEARSGVVEVGSPRVAEVAPAPRAGFAPASRAMVLPIGRATGEQPAGLLVIGLNSGRPLDEDYRTFLQLATGHVAAGIANATAFEAERRRAEQLAALDEAKSRFFANVSHEFRTPLTLMLGPLEDTLADPLGLRPEDRERVEMIQRNALRLLKLVNTLLDFSRSDAGATRPHLVPTNLARLTTELAGLFRPVLERGGLRLLVDCPPLPRPVLVDPDMWEKILFNLLSNAFKFTFDGEVRVSVRAEGERVRVSVSDTGAGIPEAEVPHLFDRFHQVSGTPSRSEEGSGIGLSLVAELVRRHGGAVEVTSTLGAGSTFTVLLPFHPSLHPTPAIPDPETVPSGFEIVAPGFEIVAPGIEIVAPGSELVTPGGGTVADGWSSGDRSTAFVQEALGWAPPVVPGPEEPAPEVLIVDDNSDMRAHLTRLLAPHWRVRAVPDGRAALDVIAQVTPELVLTDAMMPRLDGFALIKALRAGDATRHIPVIMVSARAGQEATVEGLDAGADDYLIKPFTAAELRARVRTHLLTARQRRQAAGRLQSLADLTLRLNAGLDPVRIAEVLCAELVPAYAGGCAVWPHPDSERLAFEQGANRLDPSTPERPLHLTTAPGLPDIAHAVLRRSPTPPYATLGQPPDAARPEDGDGVPGEGELVLALVLPGSNGVARTVGVVRLVAPTPAASHPDERPYLRELLDRTALALANAERYDREHHIALHLQRSLLPQALPVLDGVTLAARYVAGAAGHQVGGDWYDAFVLPGGRVGLTIGDVMGRGVRAAALMGRLRTAVRVYGLEGMPPATLLDRLNAFLHSGDERQFTTLCYGIYDPATRRLELANGGHLPPVLVPATGQARLLPVHHGLALGVGATFTYTSQGFTVPPGSALLFYTDGLVETRRQPIAERLGLLCDALTGHAGDPDALCARAMSALPPGDSAPADSDDIALLALRT